MARPSDQDLDQLAGLLRMARPLVQARAAALNPPATDDITLWRTWVTSLTDAQLVQLLEALPMSDAYRSILATLRLGGGVQNADEAPHMVLGGTMLVVDRVDVWGLLKLVHAGDKRILEVRGNTRTGKTYVRWMVNELCNRLGPGHHVQYIDLDGGKSLKFIATKIANGLGKPITIDNDDADSTPQAWGRMVAEQVYELLLNAAPIRTRWLIFDHFDDFVAKQNDPLDPVILFFVQLAELVALAKFDPNIANGPRLVLIDHGVELTPVAAGVTRDVEVTPVQVADIMRFVLCVVPGSPTAQQDAEQIFNAARADADARIAKLQKADSGVVPADPFMEVLPTHLAKFIASLKPAGAPP